MHSPFFSESVTTIPSGTNPGKVSRVGVGGTVGGMDVSVIVGGMDVGVIVGGMDVGVIVGGRDVGVFVEVGTDMSASAVWVADISAAALVELPSSSARGGPQECNKLIATKPTEIDNEVLFRFIIG